MNIKKLMAKREGFTLVEILVVILIIGLLFVFLVPKISSSTDKAREVGLKTDFHSFETAFEQLMKEKSGLGANAGLSNESETVAAVNEFLDPALKITYSASGSTSAKKDPWNNQYKFRSINTANSNNGYVEIKSMGKDSTAETTGVTAVAATVVAANATTNADGFQTAVHNATGASTKDGHDYILGCAYINGVEYTATSGFSTNIEAGKVTAATPTPTPNP